MLDYFFTYLYHTKYLQMINEHINEDPEVDQEGQEQASIERGEKEYEGIDWKRRISQKEVTDDQWLMWKADSQDYLTCASGNCVISRNEDGEPNDIFMFKLSQKFHEAVINKDQKGMELFLEAIEQRYLKLKEGAK